MTTTYEWTLEEIDQYGDIIDVDFRDKLAEFNVNPLTVFTTNEDGSTQALGIAKSVHEWDGELLVRAYAYIDPSSLQLETEFDNGNGNVPKRLIAEAQRWATEAR